jgi:uncharacterized protein (TIGR02145 family)
LYNWAGATNNENGSTGNQSDAAYDTNYEKIPGVCPTGWYLPSDRDWNDLEKVIRDDASGVYSDTETSNVLDGTWRTDTGYRGNHGTKMKSNEQIGSQPPNGTSKSALTGGFAALLVGGVGNGSRNLFGENTYFFSSSSNSGTGAWGRYLNYDEPGVRRASLNLSYLFSVRCKKDN